MKKIQLFLFLCVISGLAYHDILNKMNDATIFCLCLHDGLLEKVKQLGYTPVGLGKNNFSDDWIKDSSGLNISEKNIYYGEHSFHYWIWKNWIEIG